MTWAQGLSDAIGYVGQETLQYAAEMMVDVSEDDVSQHQTWIHAFDESLSQCRAGNKRVLSIVNTYGIHAVTLPSTQRMLEEFRRLYLQEYESR